jgi:hypothetical protein
MQFDRNLPDPWPEDLYWFDLYDRFPLLVRYNSFYADDFQSREDNVQVWYYSKRATMDATPENYIDVVNRLLVQLGATEFLQ